MQTEVKIAETGLHRLPSLSLSREESYVSRKLFHLSITDKRSNNSTEYIHILNLNSLNFYHLLVVPFIHL
jgi:hypothetical protein